MAQLLVGTSSKDSAQYLCGRLHELGRPCTTMQPEVPNLSGFGFVPPAVLPCTFVDGARRGRHCRTTEIVNSQEAHGCFQIVASEKKFLRVRSSCEASALEMRDSACRSPQSFKPLQKPSRSDSDCPQPEPFPYRSRGWGACACSWSRGRVRVSECVHLRAGSGRGVHVWAWVCGCGIGGDM